MSRTESESRRALRAVLGLIILAIGVAVAIRWLPWATTAPSGTENGEAPDGQFAGEPATRVPGRPPRSTLPRYWAGVWGHGRDSRTWELQIRVTMPKEESGPTDESVLAISRHLLPHRTDAPPPVLYVLRGRWQPGDADRKRWIPNGGGQYHWLEGSVEHVRPLVGVSGSVVFHGAFMESATASLVVDGEVMAFTAVGIGDRQSGRMYAAPEALPADQRPGFPGEVEALLAEARKQPGVAVTGWMQRDRLLVSVSLHPDKWAIGFSMQPGSTPGQVAHANRVIRLWLQTAFPGHEFSDGDFRPMDMSEGVLVQVPRQD